jgi:hypothetical protein
MSYSQAFKSRSGDAKLLTVALQIGRTAPPIARRLPHDQRRIADNEQVGRTQIARNIQCIKQRHPFRIVVAAYP